MYVVNYGKVYIGKVLPLCITMYLKNARQQTVYTFKYFTPHEDMLNDRHNFGSNKVDAVDDIEDTEEIMKKHRHMKSFLDQDTNTFARIRKRLSTLTLSTAYRKGIESPLIVPPIKDTRHVQRRINSISSRDDTDRKHGGHGLSKVRVNSRSSFLSDDKEFRTTRAPVLAVTRHRASETAALNKVTESYVTLNQNPELFSRHIKLRDKESGKTYRSDSPKSFKSNESSGKIHMGLIESLDLNERLSDLEKIKARYSNDEFINSLTLYKMRGHDRCFNHDGSTEHIRRGTVLAPLDQSRASSKLTWESGYAIDDFQSPRFTHNSLSEWEIDTSSTLAQNVEAKNKTSTSNLSSLLKPRTPVKRKKSVDFDMEPKDLLEMSGMKTPSTHSETFGKEKELKSILKKKKKSNHMKEKSRDALSAEDEFLMNDSYCWKFHLPKIHSPVQTRRPKPSSSFNRKMYHYGDGISHEFEEVICTYGNCRQNSIIREKSLTRDQSFQSSKV